MSHVRELGIFETGNVVIVSRGYSKVTNQDKLKFTSHNTKLIYRKKFCTPLQPF